MTIEPSKLFDRLQSLAPFEDESMARHALDATLKALRRALVDDEADWLALDLGLELATPLVRGIYTRRLSLDEFYRWVARFSGLRRSVAKEQSQVVCRALTECLSPGTVARLRRSLPDLASLFTLPDPERPASGPHHVREDPGPDHTLAGGRSGGERPLCDARVASDIEELQAGSSRSQAHSIAASDDPHADTKLSSSHGLTQERDHRSLSTARPLRRR